MAKPIHDGKAVDSFERQLDKSRITETLMKTKKLFAFLLAVLLLLPPFSAQAGKAELPAADEPILCAAVGGEPSAPPNVFVAFFETLLSRFEALGIELRALLSIGREKPKMSETMKIISVFTDKARYEPGEQPVVTIAVSSEVDADAELVVRATHFTEKVCEGTAPVSLRAGETVERTAQLQLPSADFTAYAVEVCLTQSGTTVAGAMTAAEVASDWSRYPRYGYLTNYGEQTAEELDATLARLNRHHVTGLFFYDVLDRHDKPLAGTVEQPDPTWRTLAGSTASFNTVKGLIDRGHAYGMNSYLYNLIFGAYQDYADHGVSPSWGLYRDRDGRQQDYHGELLSWWETQRIYLFDPANTDWQDHYLNVTKDVLDVFGYDGVQVDSLGGRGDLYDYNGNAVDLAKSYVPLLNRLHDELGTRVIFNPVSAYGMPETMAGTDYDVGYEEFWPSDGSGYRNLRDTAFWLRSYMKNDKGLVIAAYMNNRNPSGVFKPAGILLTDTVLMACGAAHLELGDTGMLRSEYYPGGTHQISAELENALLRYNSFFVAYENVLRDAAFAPSARRTKLNGKTVSDEPELGKIWRINRENERGDMLLNFINLVGVSSLEWADADGTQTMPEAQKNIRVRQYVQTLPKHIYLASPDVDEGIMTELPFTVGVDARGRYVSFVMPELAIWNSVYLTQGTK